MYKLALAAVVSLVFACAPAHAAGAGVPEGGGASAGDVQVAQKTRKAVKKTRKKAVNKARARRQDLADSQRMVRRVEMVRGERKLTYRRVRRAAPAVAGPSAGDLAGLNLTRDPLALRSNVAFVLDQNSSEVLFEKNPDVPLPIASITKLMTGLVVVQAGQDMDEILTITDDDVDRHKFTSSRLRVGARLTRANLLHLSLMSSENRAAAALGRNYPGGIAAFVAAMNAKARELGMNDTNYVDSSGLSSRNVSSARDLARLVAVAYQEPLLRQYSTDPNSVVVANGRPLRFSNTNYLVASPDWNIGLQKTGFINEAGRCLVMQAMIQGRNVIMVFLDSKGKMSRTADAGRMRRWLEALAPAGISADSAQAVMTSVATSPALQIK